MDPQQRLFVEVSWEALENAAIRGDMLEGTPTGVFFGISTSDYADLLGRNGTEWPGCVFRLRRGAFCVCR